MMRRLRTLTPLSALVGLWFLVAGREVPFAHQCVAPSAVSVAAHENAPAPSHGSHSAHRHAMPAQHSEAPVPEAPVPEAPVPEAPVPEAPVPEAPVPATPAHDCDCLGDCCAVAAPSLAASPHALAVTVRAFATGAAYPPHTGPAERNASYRQPFAIGPPSPDVA